VTHGKPMKADYQSFKRAAATSLLGLGLQLAMGLVLLIYGVVRHDQAAQNGACYVLLGIAVWLILAVVFDQHRRERIEALEADALAQAGARESSVFGQQADEMRVAAKRLAWMHKVLVPVVSLMLAAALFGLGWWRFGIGKALFDNDIYRKTIADAAEKGVVHDHGWLIAIGLGLAFTGFVFARYVSGMAKQPVWANLKAGAAQAVGAAVVGLALAVGSFVESLGQNVIARALPAAIPIFMMVMSGEIVLNFLLGVYRPRTPGEIPRPALDSRILGFIAAPDRLAESIGGALNYQFGFDVTGSWFYQLLSKSVTALVLMGLVVIWGLTCVTSRVSASGSEKTSAKGSSCLRAPTSSCPGRWSGSSDSMLRQSARSCWAGRHRRQGWSAIRRARSRFSGPTITAFRRSSSRFVPRPTPRRAPTAGVPGATSLWSPRRCRCISS